MLPVTRPLVALVLASWATSQLAAQAAAARPPRLHVVRSIPSPDAPFYFGSVVDLVLGEAGDVTVLDAINRTAYRIDPKGDLTDSVARRGYGPGEVESPIGLATSSDGRIAMVDLTTHRISVFGRNGSLDGTTRFDVVPLGVWWSSAGPVVRLFRPRRDTAEVLFVRLHPVTLHATDTIATYRVRPVEPGGVISSPCEYCGAVVSSGGRVLVAGLDSVFSIAELSSQGRVVRHIDRPSLAPVRVSQREIDEIRENVRRTTGREPRQIRQYRPAIRAIELDEYGRIWVLRPGEDQNSFLDVLTPAGQLVATYSVPHNVSVVSVRGGLVAIATLSDAEEPIILVLRADGLPPVVQGDR